MRTEVVATSHSAAPPRSLFPVLASIGRNVMAVSANFGRLVRPPMGFPQNGIVAVLHSEDVEVPSRRPMTEWEREDIAERVAAKLSQSRRGRGRIFDVEPLELETVAGKAVQIETLRKDQHGRTHRTRVPRKLLEPPTELTLRAQQLLRTIGRGKYRNTKITILVEEMIRAAWARELGATFEDEKARLRRWLKAERAKLGTKCNSAQKSKGIVPQLSTLDKTINSLKRIYQVLAAELRSKLRAKSEVV